MWTVIFTTVLFISGCLIAEEHFFLKASYIVIGETIKVEKSTDSDGTTYRPVVEFKDNNQQIRTYTPWFFTSARYFVGEKTPVAIQIKEPENVRLFTFWSRFGWKLILVFLSLPFVLQGPLTHLMNAFYLKN